MAFLPESETWETGIYQIETTDLVLGGPTGPSNAPLIDLANRTSWLKKQIVDRLGASSNLSQCIVSCKHTNGNPSAFGYLSAISTNFRITASATDPVVLSFAGGYTANGPVNYYAIITSDVNINTAPAGNTNYNFVAELDPVTGVVTYTFEAYIDPVYSITAPTSPADGTYWFDINRNVMYKRVAGVWVAKVALILCKTNAWYADAGYGLGIYNVGYNVRVGVSPRPYFYGDYVPVGTIVPYGGSTPPPGFLACNGALLDTNVYVRLYGVIQSQYGGIPGYFSLPDLRGEFIRGWDNGRGVDSGRALGSSQSESVNTAGVQLREGNATWAASGSAIGSSQAYFENSNIASYGSNMILLGGTETRPRNVAVNFIIKY